MKRLDHSASMPRRARRLLGAVFGAALAITIASPLPGSASNGRGPLERLLVELWTDVLETPAADNPFVTGTDACWKVGPHDRIVSPFAANGVDACTVRRGTPLLVVVTSLECSDIEANGTTVEELRACAETNRTDNPIHDLRVDGHRYPVLGIETDDFHWTVPEGSLFEPDFPLAVPGAPGMSVAFGWVTILPPLPVGDHTLTMRNGTPSNISMNTTMITVTR